MSVHPIHRRGARPWRGVVGWCAAVALVIIGVVGWLGATAHGRNQLSHQYQRIAFQWIADQETRGIHDRQAQAIRLHEYVHERLYQPSSEKPIGDLEPIEILAAQRGWCDQQAAVFIQLARTLPLDSRLVFLQDGHGSSPHSVAEVYFDGHWRIVDPFLGMIITNREGQLASREELGADLQLLTDLPQVRALAASGFATDFVKMAGWYRNPPTIFNTWRGKRQGWLDRCPSALRRLLVCAVQDLYLALCPSVMARSRLERQLRRAKHYALVGRSRSAQRILKGLIRQEAESRVQESAAFFLGRLYQSQGRLPQARVVLEALLREHPHTGWAPMGRAALGAVYEAMHEPALAIAAYEESGLQKTEAPIGTRVMALRALLNKKGLL